MQELQLPCVGKCQQDELGDGAAIGHLLFLGMGALFPKGKERLKLEQTVLSKATPFFIEIPPR